MFCPQCGTKVSVDGRYCAHCGALLPELEDDHPARPGGVQPSPQSANAPKDLGAALTVWRKTRLLSRHSSKPVFDLDWLSSEVDVVLTSDAVVVVAASPVSKVYSSVEAINNVAVASAPGAGFVFALPLAIVAEAYEKLFGKQNKLEEGSLTPLFDVGRVLWIRKADARFRYFEVNGGFFGQCENVCAVSGVFQHKEKQVETCITASDQLLPRLSEIRKGFQKPQYPLEHIRVKKSAEVHRILDSEYPYPSWSTILAHVL